MGDRTGLVPDVRVSGEDSVLEGLGGHPADGQQPLPPLPVIVRLIDVSRHPKICEEERGREVTLGEHCGAEVERTMTAQRGPVPSAEPRGRSCRCPCGRLMGSVSHMTSKHPDISAFKYIYTVVLLKR